MGEKHVKNPPEELILYNKKLILPIIVMSHDSELDSFLNWTFRDAISLRKKKRNIKFIFQHHISRYRCEIELYLLLLLCTNAHLILNN